MTRWTRSLKKEKSEPTISGALFYLSNRSRIQVNVSPIDARESIAFLPFRPLPVASTPFRVHLVRCSDMSGFGVPAQPVDATQALNLSAGVSNCNVSRGRSLS